MQWHDIEVTLSHINADSRALVNECNGMVQSGEILALIGQSKVGKSKLLHTLAGKSDTKIVGGTLRMLDGSPNPIDAWIGDTVELDAPMNEELSLREILEYNPRFRDANVEAIRKRATELLELFGQRENSEKPVPMLPLSESLRGPRRTISISRVCHF